MPRLIGKAIDNSFNDIIINDEILFANFEITENEQGSPFDPTDNTLDINSNGTNLLRLTQTGDLTLSGTSADLIVGGDLTVNGDTTFLNTTNLEVEDPLTFIASANVADTLDTGYYAKYNDGTDRFTGIFRDATDGAYRVFDNLTVIPTTTVATGDGSYNELFTILANGDVGIGDTTPSFPLDVVGDIRTTTAYNIGANEVLSGTTLGSLVVNSSLTNVGTLTSLTMGGDIAMGTNDITGATSITATNLTGTLQTAAQGNVTSLGTLTSLTMGGDIAMGTNDITGATNITATNLTGTLQTAAQPNITSASLTANSGNLTNTGTLIVTDDLTVDTNTLFVDASLDRVGVGTVTPLYPLHVEKDEEVVAHFRRTTVGGVFIDMSDSVLLNTQSRMRIGFDTNDVPTNNIPACQVLADEAAGNLLLSSRTDLASGIKFYTNVGTAAVERMSISSAGDLIVDTDTLFVDISTDRVGINTSTPATPLDVFFDGNVTVAHFLTNAVAGASVIKVENNTGVVATFGANGGGLAAGGDTIAYIGTSSNHDVAFFANNNNTTTIQASTGHLAIGNGAPALHAQLDLKLASGALLLPRLTTVQRSALTAINGMMLYNSTNNEFEFYENGSWVSGSGLA